MADISLIKSGDVLFQMKSLLKVSWVKKFCVLHRQTGEEHAYMELFDDKQAFTEYKQKQKKCDIRKFELHDLKSLKTSSEKKKDGVEYTVEFRIGRKCHFFLFKKESDFSDWHSKLDSVYSGGTGGSRENSASFGDSGDDSCDENDEVITVNQMYAQTDAAERFSVTVEDSSLAKLCNIAGQMTLLVGRSDIAFEDPKSRTLKYSFQLASMRRFGKVGNSRFSFEVGRKCPNGEGEVICETSSAKQIHKLVTKKSQSSSQTVIPHSPVRKVPDKIIQPLPTNSEKVQEEPPLPKKPDDLGISPSPVPINLTPKHPGVGKKLPTLNPIIHQAPEDDTVHTKSKSLRGSKESEKHSIKGNGHTRPASYNTAVTNPLVTKELEEKFQEAYEEPAHDHGPVKKDSVKTKEDKKKEREERKERERREKEEKKEEERRMKEQEKERKQKEKEAKKSGKKHKDSEKPEISIRTGSFVIGGSSLYEETDMLGPVKPESSIRKGSFKIGGSSLYEEADMLAPVKPLEDDPSCLYDEASSPLQVSEYAQSIKHKKKSIVVNKCNDESLYDEAVSVNTNAKQDPDKVVYAQPYTNKGGVPVPNCDLYADVKHVRGDAWMQAGRETEEQVFEEDYSNIKMAREQMDKHAPPILPAKNYDSDGIDDTYDTIGLKSKNSKSVPKTNTDNLYGIASATEVGKLPDIVEPEADYATDSDEGEEATYDDPHYDYDDYQTPADIQSSSNSGVGADKYEEAVVPVPTKPPPKTSGRRQPDQGLYEDIV